MDDIADSIEDPVGDRVDILRKAHAKLLEDHGGEDGVNKFYQRKCTELLERYNCPPNPSGDYADDVGILASAMRLLFEEAKKDRHVSKIPKKSRIKVWA